jgi:hypothetical protein
LRFELDGPDEAVLLRLRGEIAGGAESWIPAALDGALAAVDEPGRTLHIERLEVDLGLLPPEGVTSALLAAALQASLARHLRPGADGGPPPRVSGDASSLAEALRYFLERGRLPWWSPHDSLAALEGAVLALAGAALRDLAAMLAVVLRQPRAARRLVLQVDPAVALALAAALPGAAAGEFAAAWQAVAGIPAARREAAVVALVARVRRAAGAQADAGAVPRETPPPAVDVRPSDRPQAEPLASDATLPEPALDAAIAVADAGLVLLHPFLPALFEARGLAAGGRFPDDSAQQRAIHLTAFLASGEGAPREPDLVMAKLLCGWPLDEPVVPSPVTDDDRAEAEELLAAAIGHWTALGDASPAALRETFLARPGRLTETAEAWRLEVERSGADVLLDRLPWGLSPVRLPWMPRPLFVDWG